MVAYYDPLQNDQAMLEEEKLLLEEEKILLEERVQELTLQLEKAQVHLVTIGRVLISRIYYGKL